MSGVLVVGDSQTFVKALSDWSSKIFLGGQMSFLYLVFTTFGQKNVFSVAIAT